MYVCMYVYICVGARVYLYAHIFKVYLGIFMSYPQISESR